jgi:DNA-binding transcriptional LysR family regulator
VAANGEGDRSHVDIVLLKTFLEVARNGHFGKAADALCVTQSAVSARIKLLEVTLGVELFSRKRNDIQLTPAGHRLRPHAETIVRSWGRAYQDLSLGGRFAQSLAIGTQADLWPICVREWTLAARRARPDLALQVEVLTSDLLMQRLMANHLDLAFLFEPPQSPELVLEQVARIPLVMVCNRPDCTLEQAMGPEYVLVDWGTSFLISHSRHFPDLPVSALRVSQGMLGLDALLCDGGCAYLARQAVEGLLEHGALYLVADAPAIERHAYAAYRSDTANQALIDAVLTLARAAPGALSV